MTGNVNLGTLKAAAIEKYDFENVKNTISSRIKDLMDQEGAFTLDSRGDLIVVNPPKGGITAFTDFSRGSLTPSTRNSNGSLTRFPPFSAILPLTLFSEKPWLTALTPEAMRKSRLMDVGASEKCL